MVFDVASVFSFDWNWKFSVAMLPLILLTLAPSTEAKYDFPVYRMNQYDMTKEPYGSRTSLVSFEGRTSEASQIARKTVLLRIEELSTLFYTILEKGPGAILVLLPDEINGPSFPANFSSERIQKIQEAEKVLLGASATNVPIYFAYENSELASIYGELTTSAEFTGAKALLNAGNQVVHQFSVTGPQQIKKQKLTALESSLKGSKADARVVLITSKLDSFAASFGLARGANAATGTALLLELARLLSIVYEDDSTRPRVTTIFALMPADSFNYMASKDYLTEVGRDGVEFNLKNIDLAICLDGIGHSGPLNVHVSKPPKEGTLARFFLDTLESNNYQVEVNTVHKKINLGSEKVFWQHEPFSRFGKIPSMTISTSVDPDDIMRKSILDVYSLIDENALKNNVAAISDAVISTVYQSKVEDEGLAVSFDAVTAWTQQLSTEARPAGNITSRVTKDIVKHLERFSSDGKVEERRVCADLTLYDQNLAVMSQFLVRPALFDLYLGALIFSYLGVIYLAIEHFGVFLAIAVPILSKPELFKKQKSL